uniref:DUF148 domain-containing protein n=1 Tax=Caenorhabditis tropicalis TaxID=1561998 RepID=A0A1I7TI56_9PELO
MTRRVLLLSASVLLAAAGYAPEPYYNKYGGYHKALDKKHGGYEADQEGYGGRNGMSDYGSEQGAYGHYDGKYGEAGKKSGAEYYAKGDEHGHGDEAHEKGLKKKGDAYGGKKFSYFTSGSGPYGSYQKGYYGSDGYEHDDHKSKYSSHNEDNGFKKGYDGAGAGHDDKYTSYDKKQREIGARDLLDGVVLSEETDAEKFQEEAFLKMKHKLMSMAPPSSTLERRILDQELLQQESHLNNCI